MTSMASPPSDDTKTLFRIIGDGQWHEYQVVKEAIAAKVPPGRALRRYKDRLRANQEWRNRPFTESPLTEDEQIRLGGLACAQGALSKWAGKALMIQTIEGVKKVRIKPGYKGSWWLETSGSEESQDPGSEGGGYPDVPPGDSEPSEPSPPPSDGLSAADAGGAVVEQEGAEAVESVGRPPLDQVMETLRRSDASAEPVEDLKPPAEAPLLVEDYTPQPPSRGVTDPAMTECSICGLQVLNQVRHDEWHEAQKSVLDRPEMALLDENALRTLLGDVMEQGLDRFQEGMQGWLSMQFLQLEQALAGQRKLSGRWAAGE